MEQLQVRLGEAWAWIMAATEDPDDRWLIAVAVVGLLVGLSRWRIVTTAVTVAHESGHALVAVLTRRRAVRVRIHADGSGSTHMVGKPHGLADTVVALVGYPFPAVVGAGLIAASVSGRARLWVVVSMLLLLLLLLRTRNLHGWLAVAGWAALAAAAVWLLPGAWLALLLAGTGTALLAGAAQSLVDERRLRRSGHRGTDVAMLADAGTLPAWLAWLAMAAVVVGCGWLAWNDLAAAVAPA